MPLVCYSTTTPRFLQSLAFNDALMLHVFAAIQLQHDAAIFMASAFMPLARPDFFVKDAGLLGKLGRTLREEAIAARSISRHNLKNRLHDDA